MEFQKPTTPVEQKRNTQCLNHFIQAMIELDSHLLEMCLHKDGSFFGYSFETFLPQIYSVFVSIKKQHHGSALRNGVCLDEIVGAHVLEIRYAPSESLLHETGYYLPAPGSQQREGERILIFAISFEDGLIKQLVLTKHYVFSDRIPSFEENCILN